MKLLQLFAVPNWTPPAEWSWCELTQEELSRLVYGRPARKRVMRLLRLPAMHRWVQRERGWRRQPGTGRQIRGADRYKVVMFPPPMPGDEAVPVVAMGERLIREGALLPGDRPAGAGLPQAVASSGTQPVGKVGEKIPRPMSPTGTQPIGEAGENARFGPPRASLGQQDIVVNDDVQRLAQLSALMRCGMGQKVACDLMARFSAERIERNIALLRADPGRIKSPPAWLRTAIEEDYAGKQTGAGAAAGGSRGPGGGGHLTPTPGGRPEMEERAARAAAMYERLGEPDRRAIRERAERALREEYAQFGPGARVGEGAILARIYEWLLAQGAGDAVAAPTPAAAPLPFPPAQIAARFFRWYARKHRASGVDITVPLRAPSAVRARRIAWAVMQAFEASLREIGAIAGVDKTTVQYGLRQVQHRPDERAEADRWRGQFLEALEDFTWPEPLHTP